MPVPPDLQDNGWLSVPFAEYISKRGATSEVSLGYEGGNQAVLNILINWEDAYQAVSDILGTNVYNDVTGNLDRVLPVQHPVFTSLYATRIASMRPMRFRKKGLYPESFAGVVTSNYTFWLITILFTQPRFVMMDDFRLDSLYGLDPETGLRQEYRRFIEILPEPSGDTLLIPKDTFSWVDGPDAGSPFGQDEAQFLPKMDMIFRWHRVPRAGLFADGGQGLPLKIMRAMFTVNDSAWPATNAALDQFDINSILVKPPRFTMIESPIPQELAGDILSDGQPNLLCTVDIPFTWFEPPAGANQYGHNMALDPTDNKWYLVSKDGLVTGQRRVNPAPLSNVFTLNP